jgi:hypothetical protein
LFYKVYSYISQACQTFLYSNRISSELSSSFYKWNYYIWLLLCCQSWFCGCCWIASYYFFCFWSNRAYSGGFYMTYLLCFVLFISIDSIYICNRLHTLYILSSTEHQATLLFNIIDIIHICKSKNMHKKSSSK